MQWYWFVILPNIFYKRKIYLSQDLSALRICLDGESLFKGDEK